MLWTNDVQSGIELVQSIMSLRQKYHENVLLSPECGNAETFSHRRFPVLWNNVGFCGENYISHHLTLYLSRWNEIHHLVIQVVSSNLKYMGFYQTHHCNSRVVDCSHKEKNRRKLDGIQQTKSVYLCLNDWMLLIDSVPIPSTFRRIFSQVWTKH